MVFGKMNNLKVEFLKWLKKRLYENIVGLEESEQNN